MEFFILENGTDYPCFYFGHVIRRYTKKNRYVQIGCLGFGFFASNSYGQKEPWMELKAKSFQVSVYGQIKVEKHQFVEKLRKSNDSFFGANYTSRKTRRMSRLFHKYSETSLVCDWLSGDLTDDQAEKHPLLLACVSLRDKNINWDSKPEQHPTKNIQPLGVCI